MRPLVGLAAWTAALFMCPGCVAVPETHCAVAHKHAGHSESQESQSGKEYGEQFRVITLSKVILDSWALTGKMPKRLSQVEKSFLSAEWREFGSHEKADYRWWLSKPDGRLVTLFAQEYMAGKPVHARPFDWEVVNADPRLVWQVRWFADRRGQEQLWNTDLNLAHLLARLLVGEEQRTGKPLLRWADVKGLQPDFGLLLARQAPKRLTWTRVVRRGKPGYLVTLVRRKRRIFYPCSGSLSPDDGYPIVIKLERIPGPKPR